jgi:hypothetical protein
VCLEQKAGKGRVIALRSRYRSENQRGARFRLDPGGHGHISEDLKE